MGNDIFSEAMLTAQMEIAQITGNESLKKTYSSIMEEEESLTGFQPKTPSKMERQFRPNSTAIAYVDGSYNKDDEQWGYGVIMFDSESGEQTSEVFMGRGKKYKEQRNVAGEVYAATRCIREAILGGYANVIIHYDYEGIRSWGEGLWKANNEMTQGYKEYVQKKQYEINISFKKVKAHSGDKFNSMVDELARKAAYSICL